MQFSVNIKKNESTKNKTKNKKELILSPIDIINIAFKIILDNGECNFPLAGV